MYPSISSSASAGIEANGHDLLYLALTGACLLVALHYLGRTVAPVGPLIRIVAAAAMAALSIGAALVLLVAVTIGGR